MLLAGDIALTTVPVGSAAGWQSTTLYRLTIASWLALGRPGLIGFAFTTLGMSLAKVGEGVVQVVRGWLRISGKGAAPPPQVRRRPPPLDCGQWRAGAIVALDTGCRENQARRFAQASAFQNDMSGKFRTKNRPAGDYRAVGTALGGRKRMRAPPG